MKMFVTFWNNYKRWQNIFRCIQKNQQQSTKPNLESFSLRLRKKVHWASKLRNFIISSSSKFISHATSSHVWVLKTAKIISLEIGSLIKSISGNESSGASSNKIGLILNPQKVGSVVWDVCWLVLLVITVAAADATTVRRIVDHSYYYCSCNCHIIDYYYYYCYCYRLSLWLPRWNLPKKEQQQQTQPCCWICCWRRRNDARDKHEHLSNAHGIIPLTNPESLSSQ